MTAEIQALAADCVAHLSREESFLESLQEVVENMRASLLSRNHDELGQLIDQHATVALEIERIARNRNLLRQRISRAFGVPADAATLGLLIGQCDRQLQLAIEGYRTRLKAAGEGLNKLLIANGNLAVQLVELLENVFRTLSGDPARSPRYERNGRPSVL